MDETACPISLSARELTDRAGLSAQRVGKLLRPPLHLLLETDIQFLQPDAHVIEAIGEEFELVAGRHRYPLIEIAGSHAGSAVRQRLDRLDHTLSEPERRGGSDAETDERQHQRPLQ